MGRKPKKSNEEFPKSGRLGRLDEHTMGYYRRVSDKIQEGFDNEEEKDMFVKNVTSELESNEIKLSQNQTVSRILEMILPLLSRDQVTTFLLGMATDLCTAASDRFASHVLQSALMEAVKHVTKEESDDVEQIYVTICKQMMENLDEVMMDTYASHVLRSVIACLAGIQVPDNVSRSKLSRGQQHKDSVSETKVILSSPPGSFLNCLNEVSQSIMVQERWDDYLTSATSGPVLEVLLLSLHHANRGQCHVLTKLILKKSGLLQKKDQQEEGSLPSIITHPISSHLLEVIFKVIEDELLLKIVKRRFKGHLVELALHGVANFILQRLLGRTRLLTLFEDLFDEIIPQLESILAVNHSGVIQQLAAGCVSHTSKQVPFLQALMKAFHCAETRDHQNACVPVFASMVTYDVLFGDKDQSKDPSAPSSVPVIQLQGSLLLQEMLKFTKNGTILNSFLSLLPDHLVAMATQPTGSYLLEAFMKSTVIGEKKKDLFVEKLKSSCFQIACNKHGSRTIEGIFKSASIKSKFVIAESLAAREDHLLSHPFGRFVHRNLSIGHFKTRRQDWKNAQLREAKKRKLFSDIVGGGPTTKKDKMMEADAQAEDALVSKEVGMLMGAEDTDTSRLAAVQEADESDENDEIAAIFSSLPQKEKTAASRRPSRQQTEDKRKKKKRREKESIVH